MLLTGGSQPPAWQTEMHKCKQNRAWRCREPSKSVLPTPDILGYIQVSARESKEWSGETPEFVLSEPYGRKAALMGLPCAGCRGYYDATLDCCPVCRCKERVSPQACSPMNQVRLRAA